METLRGAPKLSFDTGGEFIRQTRLEVDEYLSDPRTRALGRAGLYVKGVVAFVVLFGSWLILVFGIPVCGSVCSALAGWFSGPR